MQFYTIGVYNSTDKEFFDKLKKNHIDTLCDIRQIRGVRGARYAFVNSARLQKQLAASGVQYFYAKELSPTTGMRMIQKEHDTARGVRQRTRTVLDTSFIEEYTEQVLANFDFNGFVSQLRAIGAQKIALFCVEEHHTACHRSIVADTLRKVYQFPVKHL